MAEIKATTEQAIAWFEYRVKTTPMPGARSMFEMALSALRTQQEHESNEPLTLDELRQMEGEPVWTVGVSYKIDGTFSMWDIIESVDEDGIQFGYSNEYTEWWNYGLKMQNGKLLGWLAYRSKPKEDV